MSRISHKSSASGEAKINGRKVEIRPGEMILGAARRLGIEPGEEVTIRSQRGSLDANIHLSATMQPGQFFIPMHYRETNLLTDAAFDPYSSQPAYKACAVRVERR